MKKNLSEKDSSFGMTHVKEEESDSKNVKRTQDLHVNPSKGLKNHGLSNNGMFLGLYYVKKRGLYNKGVLPLRETLSSILSTFYSLLQIST